MAVETIDKMDLPTALKIVQAMQKWRRGQGNVMPYSPKEYGLALDVLIAVAQSVLSTQKK